MEWGPSRRFDGMSKGHWAGTEVRGRSPLAWAAWAEFIYQINPRHPLQLVQAPGSLSCETLAPCSFSFSFKPSTPTRNSSSSGRGPLKKHDGPWRIFDYNFRGTNQPQNIYFFLLFLLVRFWAFLGKEGSCKSPCRKLSENFFRENSQKIDKNFDVSFPATFFVLSRFQVLLSDGSSKTLQNTFCKKIVSKSFYKKIDQKNQTDFFWPPRNQPITLRSVVFFF
jgi:hypothetical protein